METFRVGETFSVNVMQTDSEQPTSSQASAASHSAATNNATKSSDSDALAKLTLQIEKLAKQLTRAHAEKLPANRRSRSTERTATNSRSATPARETAVENDDGRCWYHRTYGNDARKCREPCTASKN